MKYQIVTFGCQMNEHDSEILAGMLEAMGYTHEKQLEECDVVIINTCCVRESAENKILGYVGNLKRVKHDNPDLVIAIGGCMVQQPGAAEKIRKKASHVDIIFGIYNIHRLPHLINEVRNGHGLQVEINQCEEKIQESLPVKRQSQLKAQVTIMFGCNNYCTYCIVPYVRGRERSRQPQEIIKEITTLGQQGFKEVMLLGQNVNSYGSDLADPIDFADLLEMLDKIEGIERIRYMTSHPRDFNKKLIETINRCKKVCEHFHLPIQAGSNHILELMNRGYSRENYLSLIKAIRHYFSDCSITTDFIVGFPGETEEDFAHTLDLVKTLEFDAAYTFLYSSRSGTPAARMVGQVSLEEKKRRLQALMKLQNSVSLTKNQKLVGKNEEILVEGVSKTRINMLSGRTRTNKIVNFPGNTALIGQIINVTITGAKTWHLEGEIQALQ